MDAISSRIISTACLGLWVASTAFAGLPQAPSSPSVQIRDHFERAQAAMQARDAASAEKEFRAILTLDSKNPGAHAGIGVLLMSRGDYNSASEEFSSALAAEPSFSKALALLGICQKRLGDRAGRASLEKSFQSLREKPLRIRVGMELADLYEQNGEVDAAGSLMRQLVQIDPENIDILFAAQRVYSELADDTMNKLAVLAPGSARMQQLVAEKLINAGDLKTAIEHYKKALEIDPRLPGVRYELGEAVLESSPADAATQAEALKELDAAIQTEGDNGKIECQLGRIAFLRSDMQQALAHYNKALALNPVDAEAQMGLAKLLMATDKPQEAVRYLRMAVQSDPLNAEAHYRLSVACRKLQQTAEADKELRLFQEIKQTKERVRELYRQMNKKPRPQDEQAPDEPSPDIKR